MGGVGLALNLISVLFLKGMHTDKLSVSLSVSWLMTKATIMTTISLYLVNATALTSNSIATTNTPPDRLHAMPTPT